MHAGDWPYERAPLAADCGPGWRPSSRPARRRAGARLARAHRRRRGPRPTASPRSGRPSAVADAVSRELPAGHGAPPRSPPSSRAFADAAALAMARGCAGWRSRPATAPCCGSSCPASPTSAPTSTAPTGRCCCARCWPPCGPRSATGCSALRLSCDELAPWAGVTPEHAVALSRDLDVDLLTVVRAGPYAGSAYRPDAHAAEGFNRDLCAQVARRRAVPGGAAGLGRRPARSPRPPWPTASATWSR